MTPSRAQHALGPTFLVSPLLQATSPAISSPPLSHSAAGELLLDTPAAPRSPKWAATPASYARSALSGLAVSRSTATAAIVMPSWACAWLCCALGRLLVPLHHQYSCRTGPQLHVPAQTTVEVPSPSSSSLSDLRSKAHRCVGAPAGL